MCVIVEILRSRHTANSHIGPGAERERKMIQKGLFRAMMIVALLCSATFTQAQLWSGIISPSRAIDWTSAGNTVINETRTKCGSTIAAYSGSAATINSAIASCAAHGYVELGAGSFNLSSGIAFSGHNNVTLRGQGANSTLLVFTGAGAGYYDAVVSIEPSDFMEINDGEQNVCDWTGTNGTAGTYSQSATSISIANCTKGAVSNLKVGNILTVDQLDETADTGEIWNCLNSTVEGGPQCSNNGTGSGGFARTDGTTITCSNCTGGVMKYRSQQQVVAVTSCDGISTAGHACSSGSAIGISPGIYMPNWRTAQKPQAFYSNTTLTGVGLENLSIDATNSGSTESIFIGRATNSWVKGVRTMKAARSHIRVMVATHIVIRDSYIYGAQTGGSQSYGVENEIAADGLIENNIAQQVTDSMPNCNGGCEGYVFGYNFAVDDVWTVSSGWMQAPFYAHSSGNAMNLWEGNIGPGYTSDDVHGTHHFDSLFRNYLTGYQTAGCGSSGPNTCTSQTIPLNLYAGTRYYNVIGNVLGTAGYHTVYTANCSTSDSCWNTVTAIFRTGQTGPGGTNNSGFCTSPSCTAQGNYDPQVLNYLMRWGNYDTVNNAVRWVSTEVPSGLPDFSNPVPATQTLPPSFYQSGKPSWFGSVAWPPIGPDVSTGNVSGVAGHANMNPAMACYTNVMQGPANGSGSALTFNASTCYTSASSGNVNPPSSPTTVVR